MSIPCLLSFIACPTTIALLACHQIITHMVVFYLPMNQSVSIHSLLSIKPVINHGLMLSLFAQDHWIGQWLMGASSLGLIGLMLIAWPKQPILSTHKLAWSLIVSGGMSNALDRFIHGGVVDYVVLHYQSLSWPGIFNVADVAICLGVLLLSMEFKSSQPSLTLKPKPTQ